MEAIVSKYAVIGAGYCADPLLETVKQTGHLPDYSDLDLDPYRYIFGGAKAVEGKIAKEIRQELNDKGSISFFKNMTPRIRSLQVKYENYVIYSTFKVELSYEIKFPIRFLGSEQYSVLRLNSYAFAPVNDTSEFIRNTDMVLDYFGDNPIVQRIESYFGKINELLTTFSKK